VATPPRARLARARASQPARTKFDIHKYSSLGASLTLKFCTPTSPAGQFAAPFSDWHLPLPPIAPSLHVSPCLYLLWSLHTGGCSRFRRSRSPPPPPSPARPRPASPPAFPPRQPGVRPAGPAAACLHRKATSLIKRGVCISPQPVQQQDVPRKETRRGSITGNAAPRSRLAGGNVPKRKGATRN